MGVGEQEDVDIDLDPLSVLRRYVEQRRSQAPLFDTQLWTASFTRYLQAAWELLHISRAFNTTTTAAAATFNEERRGLHSQKYNRKLLFHLFSNFMDDAAVDDAAAPSHSSSITGEHAPTAFLARQEYPLEGSLIAAANRAREDSEEGLDPRICSEFNHRGRGATDDSSVEQPNAPILGRKSPKQQGAATNTNTYTSTEQQQQQQQPPMKGDRVRRQQESCPCRDGPKDGDDCSCTHPHHPPIPDYVFDGRLISLNIGG